MSDDILYYTEPYTHRNHLFMDIAVFGEIKATSSELIIWGGRKNQYITA